MKRILSLFKNGLLGQNPVFILMLGLCPALAVTARLQTAAAMGITVTAALICSGVTMSLLRRRVPPRIRTAASLAVIAGYTAAAELLLEAFFLPLYDALGIFVPLIAVNCVLAFRAEHFAAQNGPFSTAADGFAMGLGFSLALCGTAVFRELLGNGTLWDVHVLPEAFPKILFFAGPPGAFLTLGFLAALFRAFVRRKGAGL